MKHKSILPVLLTISMLLTLFLVFPVSSTVTPPGGPYEPFGPRSDKLVFNIYPNPPAEYDALDIGEIDYVDWIADKTWVDTHDTAVTGETYYYERGLYQIDLNCNETFAPDNYLEPVYDTYLGKANPMSDIWFRRALSLLANKDHYVTAVLKGFGGTCDTPVGAPPSAGGPFLEYENYYYDDPAGPTPYDPAEAAAILDAHGWDDKEPDGVRNFPEWMVSGRPNIDDYLGGGLIFVQRTDKLKWMEWSHMFALEMEALGIPVWEDSKDRMDAIYQVIVFLQFHLYAGGWSFGRDPTLFMKDIWYSDLWVGQGYVNMNYAHFNDSTFDEYAIKMYYATKLGTPGNLYDPVPPDEQGAYYYCQECQRMIKEQIPCIPLVYYAGIKGYHKKVVAGPYAGTDWTGMANERGYGINTWRTPLNAHPDGVATGGHITAGLSTDVESLNIVTAMMFYDYNILDSVFSGLTGYDPNNPTFSGDIPILAKDWRMDLWDATGIMGADLPGYPNATKITYYLREDAYWHDNTPVTSADIGFTIDFILACGPAISWNWPAFEYVYNTTIIDTHTIEVFLSAQSIYFPHLVGQFPYMPKHIWEGLQDSEGRTYTHPDWDPICVEEIDVFSQPEYMIGCGPYKWANEFVRNDYYVLNAFTKYFDYNDIELYIPGSTDTMFQAGSADIQSYVGVTNRQAEPVTVTVTLEYESDGSWITIGAKQITVPGNSKRGVSFEDELNALGLVGQIKNLKATTTAPARGVTIERTHSTHITMPGDIDSNGDVGLYDATQVSTTYAQMKPWYLHEKGDTPPAWHRFVNAKGVNVQSDINLDGSVGLKDAVIVAVRY